jgi:hypothetical protein
VLASGEHAPPASVRTAPGHVGFYASHNPAAGSCACSAGIRAIKSASGIPIARVLGVRRLV